MARAIELASGAHTHPNPRVGAVVVAASGEVVGEGWYEGPGTPHAEFVALSQAGDQARGSTVFVTLEPCDHHGRTPPCVDALITAGVARVVAPVADPDSRTAGRGFERLRSQGIVVEVGMMEEEAIALDPAYFHHRRTGLPLVTWKYAMTLDGSVAAADHSSRWISSADARADAHRLRAGMDAVVVGAGTLAADDPRLDVRLPGHEEPQPRPVVILGRSDPPVHARIWDRDPLVYSTVDRSVPSGHLVLVEGQGRPDPKAVCLDLAERGLLDVMLEGGPTLAGEWQRAGVVSRGVAYIGAKLGGGVGMAPLAGVFANIDDARVVSVSDVRSLGGDVRIDFTLQDVHGNR
jgi:diaminohydroxyphosphoribosylaminopyrimidine deaminase / 5-amino-6-(5-phosphoribosylamino)uracil reductase